MSISGQGIVFGIAMARREGVPEAGTRAGLMMGLGGVSPIGAVLASSTIRAAKRARAAAGSKGNTGALPAPPAPPPVGTGVTQAGGQPAGTPPAPPATIPAPTPAPTPVTTKDLQSAIAPLQTQLARDSATLTKAIGDLAAQGKAQAITLNQAIQKLNETVDRLAKTTK